MCLTSAYRRLGAGYIRQMLVRLLGQLGMREQVIALDSTGFCVGDASVYYQSRRGRCYRHWVKGLYAVGVESKYILAFRSDWGPGNDSVHLSG
ncbi:MAG: hypothetical protein HPY54_15760 [Chthonomonadetes bacterium]|nr:hypothetical protein [Chthonomonadetes bacterium]